MVFYVGWTTDKDTSATILDLHGTPNGIWQMQELWPDGAWHMAKSGSFDGSGRYDLIIGKIVDIYPFKFCDMTAGECTDQVTNDSFIPGGVGILWPKGTPTGGGGGGGGGGGVVVVTTPPGSFPTPPRFENWQDVPKWLGDVFQWSINTLTSSLNTIFGALASALWSLLPDWLKTAIQNLEKAGSTFTDFLTDPTAWFKAWVKGIFTEGSPSTATDLAAGSQSIFDSLSKTLASTTQAEDPLQDPIFGPILRYANELGKEVGTPTDASSAEGRIYQLFTTVEPILLSLVTIQFILEKIPTLNQTGTIELLNAILEARGIYAISRGTIQPYLDHNINRMLNYQLNQKYVNVLPDLGTQIDLYNKGYWTLGILNQYGPQESGISAGTIGQMQKATRALPGLDEFILYNHRHPEAPIDWAIMQDALRIDYERYGKVFDERKYGDIPVRTLKSAYAIGAVEEGDVNSRIARAGYRSDLLAGDAKSDAEIVHDYIVSPLTTSPLRSELSSTQRLYTEGLKTDMDLRAVAEKIYKSADELTSYMNASANLKQARTIRPKHFSASQLIKMSELGIDVSGILDSDIAATGLDDTHQGILKQYIQAVVSAKQASPAAA